MKNRLLLLMAGLALVAPPGLHARPRLASDMWPLQKGFQWTFSEVAEGGHRTAWVEGRGKIGSERPWTIGLARGDARTDHVHVSVGERGIVLHALEVKGRRLDLSPGVQLCDRLLTPATAWTTITNGWSPEQGRVRWTSSVLQDQPVAVAARRLDSYVLSIAATGEQSGLPLARVDLRLVQDMGPHSVTGWAGGTVFNTLLTQFSSYPDPALVAQPLPPQPPAPVPVPAPTPVPPGAPLFIRDYVPTDPSWQWNFRDANTTEHFRMFFDGEETCNGVVCRKLVRTRDDGRGTPDHDHDLLTVDELGVRLHHRHVRGQDIRLAPPVRFSEAQIQLGQVYSTVPEMVNPATGNQTEWKVTVHPELVSVSVPSGTYQDCLKVNLFIKDRGLGSVLARVDLWYARGVGPVKRQGQFFGVLVVEELEGLQKRR